MSTVELSDALFAKMAGWEAVKHARLLLAGDRVLSSDWQPPLLRGTVQEGSSTYRAGLVINSASDAENLCPCRDSRQRGLICAHVVAVGLHFLKSRAPAKPASIPGSPKSSPAASPTKTPASSTAGQSILRAQSGDYGESLELFIILPPNFPEAAARGRIMVCIEGGSSEGRKPLNALPLTTPFTLNAQDSALLTALEKLSGGVAPALLMLDTRQFAGLLPHLVGHPGVTFGKSQEVQVSNEPVTLPVVASLESNGEILLRIKGAPPSGLIRGEQSWALVNRTFQPLGLPPGLDSLFSGPTRIPRGRVPQFLSLEWPQLMNRGNAEANFSIDDFALEAAVPRFKLHLAGGLAMLQAKLECFYNDKPAGGATSADTPWLPDPNSPTRYLTRNFAAEEAALRRLVRNGFTGPDSQGLHHLKSETLVLHFFAREYPRMEKEWEVTLEERLERSTSQKLERIEPRFQVTPSGEQWFDLQVTYDTAGGERFPQAEIQRLLRAGQSHTRLKNGKFALLDTGAVEELQEVLLDCAPRQHAGGYRLDNRQAGFLAETLRGQTGWQVQAPASWNQRAAQQRGDVQLQPPPLGALENVLRPYQKHGVAWLHFLRQNDFGGVLADEMGLGKTLQVLAHLSARTRTPGSPVLVVCPTSLVFNWAAEAAKFTPDLKVLPLQGAQRHSAFSRIADQDLVITSYALLRRDAEQYRETEFDTVVLDEAQHIKNRETQNAQAVKSIRSRHRLVLTGTPLENSVLDLWSIFDFLMPGYLGSAQDFKDRYEGPIVRESNSAARDRLARRLRPFLLRRLKREVASDLPEKIEQVSYCELGEDQRALYQQILDATRREVVNAVDPASAARGRMVVLTALLRLRQICCDPRLLKLESGETGSTADAAPVSSGKVEMFAELLQEVLDGGHRALVFSQFTSMLKLLGEHLSAQGIEFCRLDGSTPNRAAVVDSFQKNSNIPVFLISLKAGGVGLNLTGADTVIHFDPWWNPAVEAQATDRAHRIGQKKVVTSYKLITRGTVEEKILNLQAKKRALFDGMLGGEEQMTAALSWEEIQDLLAD